MGVVRVRIGNGVLLLVLLLVIALTHCSCVADAGVVDSRCGGLGELLATREADLKKCSLVQDVKVNRCLSGFERDSGALV